ncbi:MAG: alpha/beta hydrolase [Clostridia bacterium]|nr:alpha/beta hydrolase [Clostridia bacterium]
MHYLFKNEVIDYDFFNSKKDKTILFLHGWGGNKFSFQQTINLLKNQFNILTITMPSIEPTTSVWNMFDYVELVENILSLHSIKSVIIICHSFGFRVAMLLNKKIKIEKIVVTGGAGLKKENIFQKIIKNNNKILLKNKKNNYLYKKIASKDYLNLSPINKETFKSVLNLNLEFASRFNCPMLLFWGNKDTATPLWIAKHLKQQNNAILTSTNSDHFAYLKESPKFNHEVLNFLKN